MRTKYIVGGDHYRFPFGNAFQSVTISAQKYRTILYNATVMKTRKPPRRKTSSKAEATVLLECARRCPMCFHLDRDLTEKDGQIAHLDGDPSNRAEDNLAFLCLAHHSRYDSITRQHKNFTLAEVKEMRRLLKEALSQNQHVAALSVTGLQRMEADKRTFAPLLELSQTIAMRFLRSANFAGCSFSWGEFEALDRLIEESSGAEREFIDVELETLRRGFLETCKKFVECLSVNTSRTPHTPRYRAIPQQWETEQSERFAKAVEEVQLAAARTCAAYDALVRTAKRKLSV